jgi:hypothetical protein
VRVRERFGIFPGARGSQQHGEELVGTLRVPRIWREFVHMYVCVFNCLEPGDSKSVVCRLEPLISGSEGGFVQALRDNLLDKVSCDPCTAMSDKTSWHSIEVLVVLWLFRILV